MESFTFDRLLTGLRRQWWIVAQAVVIIGLATALLTARQPERPYEATTNFLVQPDQDATSMAAFTTIFASLVAKFGCRSK